jgi:hypothetical protein
MESYEYLPKYSMLGNDIDGFGDSGNNAEEYI